MPINCLKQLHHIIDDHQFKKKQSSRIFNYITKNAIKYIQSWINIFFNENEPPIRK